MMAFLNTRNLSRPRKACALAGMGLLALAILLFASTFLGIFALDTFAVLGNSGVRTLAGVAVTGCILSAIGFFEE